MAEKLSYMLHKNVGIGKSEPGPDVSVEKEPLFDVWTKYYNSDRNREASYMLSKILNISMAVGCEQTIGTVAMYFLHQGRTYIYFITEPAYGMWLWNHDP